MPDTLPDTAEDFIDMAQWNGEYLLDVIHAVGNSDLVLLEIGSYRGQSAESFMDSGLVSRIYCVDPWKAGFDPGDPASNSDFEAVERDFDRRMSKYGDRVVKCKGTLDDFLATEHLPVDMVYIDGDHRYEGVIRDIRACIDFVRPRIAYAGHDYTNRRTGVRRAVDEILGEPDRVFGNGSWIRFSDRYYAPRPRILSDVKQNKSEKTREDGMDSTNTGDYSALDVVREYAMSGRSEGADNTDDFVSVGTTGDVFYSPSRGEYYRVAKEDVGSFSIDVYRNTRTVSGYTPVKSKTSYVLSAEDARPSGEEALNLIDMSQWNGDLSEIVAYTGKRDLVLLEIGSYRGQSAESFMDSGLVSRIYCVDPWKAGFDPDDPSSDSDFEAVERDFDRRMAKYGDRVVKCKGTLDDFLATEHLPVDMVYIDGIGKYEAVYGDIKGCLDRVKPRVAYSGHDYRNWWMGVEKAVNELLGEPDTVFSNGCWVKLVKE